MAEVIILPLANSILKSIASFTGDRVRDNVAEEIKGFKSVKEDLRVIAEDLESIIAVLKDAEVKQYSNAAMKIWLNDLKSVVYDIDDLLDEVATDALHRSVNKRHLLPQFGYYLSLKPLTSRFDLSHKIKDLRLQLGRIIVKKNNFGLTDRPIEAPRVDRDVFDVCAYVNKAAIVGRDKDKQKIIRDILGLYDGSSSVRVFPILGMGGIGKTALAKLVYNDINQFDIKLWVCVSDKFDLQKILKDILKDATCENTANYNLGKLVDKLQNVLNDKKFFLVLDDMWEDAITLWVELKSILDVGRRGSVILITTRLEKVAHFTRTIKLYNLDELSVSACWCIFKNLAFADGEEERYPVLSRIGKCIVQKCSGIPLVVRSLGCLLRSERNKEEWLRIEKMDSLNQLDGQYSMVKQLLKVSYDKLPSHLKPCFAHLSLFAKERVYAPYYHLYCWSALGLLQLRDEFHLKHNLFNELVSRSMLQDVEWGFAKTGTTFKIHDILHDLARDVLGEELAVVASYNLSVPDSSRYIAWGVSDFADKDFPEQVKAKKARAFLFRYKMINVSQPFLKGIISNMPCLRFLGLGSSQFKELPYSIRYLKHLRVLDLSKNELITSLPETLCELVNLECLLLEGCKQLEELPIEIYKLASLRYLSLTTCKRSLVGTKFNRLPSLRHMCFDSCMGLESLWDSEDVGHLTSLRSIEIVDCPKLISLPNSMKQLVDLQELWIINCDMLDLESGEGLSGFQSLRTLIIEDNPWLSCVPDGIGSTAISLNYIRISNCKVLAELPDWLQSCASLRDLVIWNCHNLLSLPEGIRRLHSLQHLDIRSCPHLLQRYSDPNGEDFSRIQHVTEIWIDGLLITP